ncbi:hypothetical protein NG796_16070 [Laspinema sp. A4]|nr:hypothetical protein [Laspinema sp. D2d]MCT7984787.1 hypothetical protein [Laspinema sp. D2d]
MSPGVGTRAIASWGSPVKRFAGFLQTDPHSCPISVPWGDRSESDV